MSRPRDVWSDLVTWTRNGDTSVFFWPFLQGYSFRIARVESGVVLTDPLLYSRAIQKGIGLVDPDIVPVWDDPSPFFDAIQKKYADEGGVPLIRTSWVDVDSGWLKKESWLQPIREGVRILGSLVGGQRLLFIPVPGPLAVATLLGGKEFTRAAEEGEEEAFDLIGSAVFLANELIRQAMETGVRGILLFDGTPLVWSAACRERAAEEYRTLRNTVDYFKGMLMLRGGSQLRNEDVPAGIYDGIVPDSAETSGLLGGVAPRIAAVLPREVWKGDAREISAEALIGMVRPQMESGSGRLVTSTIPTDADPERVLKVRQLLREALL